MHYGWWHVNARTYGIPPAEGASEPLYGVNGRALGQHVRRLEANWRVSCGLMSMRVESRCTSMTMGLIIVRSKGRCGTESGRRGREGGNIHSTCREAEG